MGNMVMEVVMKLMMTALAIGALSTVGLGAQSSVTETKTKVEVKEGKEITAVGCLEQNPGGGYMLTDVSGGSTMRYMLVGDNNFSKNVGRRVMVKGKAATEGKGKVKVESSVKTSGEKDSKATTEASGDLGGMPFLGVDSFKVIADSCR
jgi:hypothetical protein